MSKVMKIFIGACFVVMTSGLASCSDDEKSDCDKVWDKLKDCCEWSSEDVSKGDFMEVCKEMEGEDGFDQSVDAVLKGSCNDDGIQYFCAY